MKSKSRFHRPDLTTDRQTELEGKIKERRKDSQRTSIKQGKKMRLKNKRVLDKDKVKEDGGGTSVSWRRRDTEWSGVYSLAEGPEDPPLLSPWL